MSQTPDVKKILDVAELLRASLTLPAGFQEPVSAEPNGPLAALNGTSPDVTLRIEGINYLSSLRKGYASYDSGEDDGIEPYAEQAVDESDARVTALIHAEGAGAPIEYTVDPDVLFRDEAIEFTLSDSDVGTLEISGRDLVAQVHDLLAARSLTRAATVRAVGPTVLLRGHAIDDARSVHAAVDTQPASPAGDDSSPLELRQDFIRFLVDRLNGPRAPGSHLPILLDEAETFLIETGRVPASKVEETARSLGRDLADGQDPAAVAVHFGTANGYGVRVEADVLKRERLAIDRADVLSILATQAAIEQHEAERSSDATPGI
ncbi:hypothetical protein J2T57_001409 [Natronocella acetinitrilica]|uniref:Uncharacterized protein n=1 Tax=Natronocella acetinitrilica TaxID=414046 RepID=A0AAE3G5M8_9GAMM|nr:hypothetical protein [Natronocella acetinitrilica]MCP1674307.1 hypothetical protein [Natronocella acetinitrilica]